MTRSRNQPRLLLLPLFPLLPVLPPRKSRMTGRLHLGQRGSASESMTYMKQRGQAARTMDAASGLLCSFSDETHELGEDESSSSSSCSTRCITCLEELPLTGGDRFSFSSNLPFLLLLRLIFRFYYRYKFL